MATTYHLLAAHLEGNWSGKVVFERAIAPVLCLQSGAGSRLPDILLLGMYVYDEGTPIGIRHML
jgi:hypothetical protein